MKSISRREFSQAAIAIGSAMASSACGEDAIISEPTDDNTDNLPDNLEAIITGPSTTKSLGLTIPVNETFDSTESTGNIKGRSWELIKEQDPFDHPKTVLGIESTATAEFLRPGTYNITLNLRGTHEAAKATHQITMQPSPLPKVDDLPLVAFYSWETIEGGFEITPVIYLNKDIGSSGEPVIDTRISQKLLKDRRLVGERLSWEPAGQRLLFEMSGMGGLSRIHTLDLLTDELVQLSDNTKFARQAIWNPRKDFIAYIDDSREAGSELVIVRPDGTETKYLSGDSPLPDFAGTRPDWDPTGEILTLANKYFYISGKWSRRLGLYEDVFTNPRRSDTHVPTEEQLNNYFQQFNLNDAELRTYFNTLDIGANGVAWSPDGEWIYYSMLFNFFPNSHPRIARSRVDGTGDIETIVDETYIRRPGEPILSSDGRIMYFSARDIRLDEESVYIVIADGGVPAKYIKDTQGTHNNTPALYQT